MYKKILQILLITVLILLIYAGFIYNQQRYSDAGLNVRQLIQKYGFPFENHTVLTMDGYILEIHRIPHGRNNNHKGPPVLVVPGALSSSADFVNAGEKSLGFMLANNGYDVWLANYRGTTWSRKHIRLNPDVDRKDYWNFSFQEIGEYDLPAFIDYILNFTKRKKIFYVGYSQGTTGFFALLSENPEYNDKIRLMAALGPSAYFSRANGFIAYLLSAFKDEIQILSERYQLFEVLPHSRMLGILGRFFCSDESPFQYFCAWIFQVCAGYSPYQINKSLIPVIVTNNPAGGSLRTWQHLGQLCSSGNFSKYDFGEEENMMKYSQPTPPSYNLSRVTVPVALYLGDKDGLVAKKDVDRLGSEMKNTVANKYLKGFNHVDVVWGVDAAALIFKEILELMKKY